MSGYKEIAQRDSCFRAGSTLCPGCMESIAFGNIGRVSDNGTKTIFTIGTSCAEVSTLAFPNVVAWGRGDQAPDDFSSPTLGEAARDVSDILAGCGALDRPVQVISASGDGGALAIGLRALLHTIHRRARITMVVLVNEIFANTGFQYSPATTPFADTSTTPTGTDSMGNARAPLDYIHLAIAAGAELVAQVSPAHGKLFVKTVEDALALESGTAVLFVPAPCISGWKFEDGKTVDLALSGAQSGVYPAFIWRRGKGGAVKDCGRAAADRPAIEEFLGQQRRFAHLVQIDKQSGKAVAKPGRERDLEAMKGWVQGNVERLYQLCELK
jgi:pyruvate ferredoxin oxidoreductase beta subunit